MRSSILALIHVWGVSVIRRVVLGSVAVVLATASLAACSRSVGTAQEGECLNNESWSNRAKIVPCSDPTAYFRVSKVLDGEGRKAECPQERGFVASTSSWSMNGKTICLLKK
jgi:hypothetical protein